MSKILREEDISMGFRAPFTVSRPVFQSAMFAFTGMAPENAKNLVIRQTFSDGVNAMTARMRF